MKLYKTSLSTLLVGIIVLSPVRAAPSVVPARIIVDKEGEPLSDQGKRMGNKVFTARIADLVNDMGDHVRTECSGKNRPAKFLILVHGGLTSVKEGLEYIDQVVNPRDKRYLKDMGDERLYTIFLNWDASLWGAWFDDLFQVRFGVRDWRVAIPTLPFSLTDRLIRGLITSPISFGYQVDSAKTGTLVERSRFGESSSLGESAVNTLTSLITAPVHIPVLPLVSGLGSGAWDMLKRRTDRMFFIEKGDHDSTRKSALRVFFEAMSERARSSWVCKTSSGQALPIEITLVGHSMGSIVINRILREFPEIELTRIIYLGAAASVQDFRDNIIPYLSPPTLKGAHFYSFSLAVKDENREQNYFGLAPRGSLLVYIENMFEPGVSGEQFRVGWWINAREILVGKKEVCSRMTFLKFPGDEESDYPKKHGEFNDDKKLQRILRIATPTGTESWNRQLCPNCDFYRPCPLS